MIDTKHSPEPWRVVLHDSGFQAHLVSKKGTAASVWSLESDVTRANAHRIVACVNALAGIEDPEAFVEEAKAAITRLQYPA